MVLQRKFEINKPEDFHFTMLLTRFTMFLASLLVCAAWQRGETSWGEEEEDVAGNGAMTHGLVCLSGHRSTSF